MGACFWVEMKLKITDRDAAAKALYSYVTDDLLRYNPRCFEGCFEEGAEKVGTVEGLLSMILASHQHGYNHITDYEDGFEVFGSAFDASYGWSKVMDDAFESIVPYLADGSTYYQACENDEDTYEIQGGKQVLIASNWR